MKKFLAIAVSVLFLLGFAASAFAIHAEIPSETQATVAKGETQLTLGGSIRVRGEIRDNTTDFNSNTGDSLSWYDQRVRLSTAIKVNDAVSGLVELESGSGSTDTYTWGESTSAATGVYGVGNGKRGTLDILQAWINYNNDLMNVKIGHMPLALGNNLFFDHRKFGDDAIVLYKDIDNIHIALLTAKFDEGTSMVTQLLCVAAGVPVAPVLGACPAGSTSVSSTTAGATSATGMASVADDADAYVALFAYKGDGYNVSGDITWVDDNAFADTDLYNLGIRGDVNLSDMFNLYADLEVQTGETGAAVGTLCGTATGCDYSGYALMAGLKAKLSSIDVGVEFGHGSGDDNAADGDIELFVNSLSSGIPYITFVHGTRAGNTGGAAGISNLTYLKGTIAGSPSEKITANGALVLLQASENCLAAAVVPGTAQTCNPGTDDIGFEVDASMTYALAKNLKYWIEGGYLFADDYYMANSDDAFALRHGIELTF